MEREDLERIKASLEAQAAEMLMLYHKALGALELVEHFLGDLEKDTLDEEE